MKEYINLVETVFDNGKVKLNRTGTKTLMYFGFHYKVDLSKGFPLLTTKKVFFNSVIRELLWYLKGETHIRNLRKHTKIWDAWTSEEKNWEIGKMYGYQWVKWEKFTEKYSRDLILLAHYFNRKALDFEPTRAPEQSRTLSPREVDAMTLIAMGYSRAQVAETLSISEHTLRVYIESARFKLGALNTTHAIARAMSRGLIVV